VVARALEDRARFLATLPQPMSKALRGGAYPAVARLDEIRSERKRILSTLLDRVDDLTEVELASIRAEIPAYAHVGSRLYDDVRDQVALHNRTLLSLFLEERAVTLEDLTFVRGAATRRARAGLALEDYVNAYRVGQQFVWDAIVELAGDTSAGHEAALGLAMPLMRYINFASTHAGHAYVEFQQYLVADADRERRDLLECLLSGEPLRGPTLAAAQTYAIGPDSQMLVAAAIPVGQPRDSLVLPAASAAVARTELHATTLVVARQAEIVAVAVLYPGTNPTDVCDQLEAAQERVSQEGIPLAIGVSTIASGVDELPRAYAEARAAVGLVRDGGGMAALPRLSPFDYLTLRADDTAHRLVDSRVRALVEEDREDGTRRGALIETIRAFAEANLNVRAAAERLWVHPNTVQYRLKRIEERTGRNPRNISDLLQVLVAATLDDGAPGQR
jgi:hypothetical protein